MRVSKAAPLLSLRTWSRLTYQTNCISYKTHYNAFAHSFISNHHHQQQQRQHWAYSERMCIVKCISASTRTEWCLARKRGARGFFLPFPSSLAFFYLYLCERPSAQFSNWFCLSCKIVTAGCCMQVHVFFALCLLLCFYVFYFLVCFGFFFRSF